jgi:hypothetical protein
MGFRFRKRVKLLPGVTLNVSKTGVSTSIGRSGATVNIRKGRTKTTIGIPGTGLSYTDETSTPSKRLGGAEHPLLGSPTRSFFAGLLAGLGPKGILGLVLVVIVFGALLLKH